MTDKNLGHSILETIKKDNITPKPKWQFLVKDYIVWAVGILSVLVGGVSFSAMLYLIVHNDWLVYKQIDHSLFHFLFVSLPHFWIISVVIFIFIAQYNLRHTREGYKYNIYVVVTGSIIVSILLGTGMYNAGMGRIIDNALVDKVPYYTKFFPGRSERWLNPEKGLLGGQIIKITGDEKIIVLSRDGREWQIDLGGASFLRGGETLEEGQIIKLIGEVRDGFFVADIALIEEFDPGVKRLRGGLLPHPTSGFRMNVPDEIKINVLRITE